MIFHFLQIDRFLICFDWLPNSQLIFFLIFCVILELLRRVDNDETDQAQELALIMFRTATIRSGFLLQDTAEYAQSVEKLISETLGLSPDEEIEEEEEIPEVAAEDKPEEEAVEEEEEVIDGEEHDEL